MTHTERAERRKAIAEHAAKHGVASAAKKFRVCSGTISESLKAHGVAALDVAVRRNKPESFQILMDLLLGEVPAEIADKYKISRQRVDQIKTKAKAAGFVINTGAVSPNPSRKR